MAPEYRSTPYDGHHAASNPNGNDWRSGGGIGGFFDRFTSYGNFSGPGNRIDVEQGDYVRRQQAADPNYSKFHDPKLQADPRYQPIDGIDAAAMRHDESYSNNLGGANMFGWQGLRNTHDADRQLVRDVNDEMNRNGSLYSEDATQYSQGMRGYFGGRVMGVDAVDWMGNKAGEVGNGVSNFVGDLGNAGSIGEAAGVIGNGAMSAGRWLGNTAGQAWDGISNAASTAWDMGWPGMVGTAGGLLNVAGAGALELGSRAGSAIADGAGALWDGATNLAGRAGSAISSGASAVMDGASNLASRAGSAISNGASAVMDGVSAVGSGIGNAASKAWDFATSW